MKPVFSASRVISLKKLLFIWYSLSRCILFIVTETGKLLAEVNLHSLNVKYLNFLDRKSI